MKPNKLFADGQELVVQKRIGKGGEGEVFSISNVPGYAIKAYLPSLAKERENKIRAMVGAKLSQTASTIAFPYQIVVDAKGDFVGFMMRLVEQHKEIHELQTPASRQVHFPKADYRFLVRTAVNVARAFAQAHAVNCIIGDVNQRGILVSPSATVTLIDADSFQVAHGGDRYLCVVGVPEYTPPELQGKSLKNIVRTVDHDAFGLAVALFQLLCMDRHPFSGRYRGPGEMPLEKAIAENRFAYSSRATGMDPPPGSVRLQDFPKKLGECFERAFSKDHIGHRPLPTRWVDVLEELEASLRPCSSNSLHHYAREASECPWCRMEREFGRPLFTGADVPHSHIPKGKIDEKYGLILDLQALLATVNGIAIPPYISIAMPSIPAGQQSSQTGQGFKSKKRWVPLQKLCGFAMVLGAAAMVYHVPSSWITAAAIGIFGMWLIVRKTDLASPLTQEHRTVTAAIKERLQVLQSSSPIDRVLKKKAEILDTIDDYKALSSSYGAVTADYDKYRQQQQLAAHLSKYSIRAAAIERLTSSDIASLASFGVATAFDATRRDVQQVYGIGPVKKSNINAWVNSLKAQFRFRSEYSNEDRNNIQRARGDIISKQQGLENKLRRLVDELRKETAVFNSWKLHQDPELVKLAEQLAQVEADFPHLGLPIPPQGHVAPYPVPSVEGFRRGATASYRYSNTSSTFRPPTAGSPPAGQPSAQSCPNCHGPMVRRVARRGARSGKPFWGCRRYPACKGTRPI